MAQSLILVHGDCPDGFTSAGLLLRRLPHAKVVYTHPSHLRSELEAAASASWDDVVLADLSPQRDDNDRILELCQSLVKEARVAWLDHHAPQWDADFEEKLRAVGVDVHVDHDEQESGASLAAAWVHETDPGLLHVADSIRKRDAWVDPQDPDARAWTLVAAHLGKDYVNRVRDANLEGLPELGAKLVEEDDRHQTRLLGRIKAHSPRVHYLFSEESISEVADRLFHADSNACVLLRFTRHGRVSVRSRAGCPIAASLSQSFGGGGHANAAGFELNLGFLDRVWMRLRRAHHARVREALQRAETAARGC